MSKSVQAIPSPADTDLLMSLEEQVTERVLTIISKTFSLDLNTSNPKVRPAADAAKDDIIYFLTQSAQFRVELSDSLKHDTPFKNVVAKVLTDKLQQQ